MMIKTLISNKIVVVVSGDGKKEISKVICDMIKPSFSVFVSEGVPGILGTFGSLFSKVIIIEDGGYDTPRKVREFMKASLSPIIVFGGKEGQLRKKKLLLRFPANGGVVMDRRLSKKIKKRKVREFITFGTGKSADLYVTDINKGEGTNFKITYKGSVTPFWINRKMKNKEIYGTVSALCVAVLLGLNLVEVSKKIRNLGFTEK